MGNLSIWFSLLFCDETAGYSRPLLGLSDDGRYSPFYLVCLFNQSCVDLIYLQLNISNISAIDSYDLIHFDVNSTVADITNEIFVDRWNYSASYRAFYQQCRPDRCTYSLNQHNSFWVILAVVFGLMSGLMGILQMIIPYFVQGMFALYSRCCHRAHTETVPPSVSFTVSFRSIVDRLYKLNLFSSDNPSVDDEHEIRGQIISTRLFLVLLLISLITLTVYSSQVQVTKTVTIANPSIQQYMSLYNNHSSTLTCPCTNIAIPQQTFLWLQPTFHQICESVFVNPAWLRSMDDAVLLGESLYVGDFRSFAGAIFTTIASFCQLSRTTISDGLLDFGKSPFVTAQIIPEHLLLKKGQSLIDLFISTSENALTTSLESIRDITQANALLAGYATSMLVELNIFNEINGQIVTLPKFYNMSSSCSCYSDPSCVEPAGFYTLPNMMLIESIPGFFIGCYITEATLKSSLAPLYNQSWIDDFRARIHLDYYYPSSINIAALNSSLDSQYNITTPINIMMQKMMTEPWKTDVNYSAYYEQCHPIECKYTYAIKYDLVYIITTIIGLMGGLVTILQLVIPRVVKWIRRCWLNRHRRPRVQVFPTIPVPEND